MPDKSPQPSALFNVTVVEDCVALTQILKRIDSSNVTLSATPDAGESGIVDYISAWLQHRGIEQHRIETVPRGHLLLVWSEERAAESRS
jgi:hypothetical protein